MPLPKLELPLYQLTVPSTGAVINFRPFLVKEHKILLTLENANSEEITRIVKELIDVCTFKQLDIKELANFDIEYIFIQLRSKSIGETLSLTLKCECGNNIEINANLADANVERKSEHSNKISLTPTIWIEMRYPSFDEVIEVYNTNDKDKVIDLVINCIKGVYDNQQYWSSADYSKNEILEFVNDFTKEQFDKIENFFVTMPKLKQTIEADCNKCGKHNKVVLEGLQSFFV